MELKPIEIEDIPKPKRGRKKSGKNVRIIEQFLDSGVHACLVDTGDKNEQQVRSMSASFCVVIRRTGYPVRQIYRAGRLFLVRTDFGKVKDGGNT